MLHNFRISYAPLCPQILPSQYRAWQSPVPTTLSLYFAFSSWHCLLASGMFCVPVLLVYRMFSCAPSSEVGIQATLWSSSIPNAQQRASRIPAIWFEGWDHVCAPSFQEMERPWDSRVQLPIPHFCQDRRRHILSKSLCPSLGRHLEGPEHRPPWQMIEHMAGCWQWTKRSWLVSS